MTAAKPMLRISPTLELPAFEAQTQTLVVYGGKGMGKTNFAAVLAEELGRQRLRFSWIDPVGVAWGLKHSSDGRGAGVEVLILGGIHGDIPINPQAGAIVADLVVDEDVSVIIDISRHRDGRMWSAGEKIRFVRDYCVRLFERQGERRRPIMQIIDEAGRFVPQVMMKGDLDIAECVGAIEQLVELGRNVGAGVALITQRSARMNKSVSELAEMMVAFRTVGPRSIDAIIDWFGEHVPKERQRELIEQLRKLDRGTALIVSPGWLDVEGSYAIRARETFDSSATPVAGQERAPRGRGATVDVGQYSARMAETIEAAKAIDPTELRKRIRELEEQLRRAMAAGREPRTLVTEVEVEKIVEVPVSAITRSHLEPTRHRLLDMRAALEEGLRELEVLGDELDVLPTASRMEVSSAAVARRPDRGDQRAARPDREIARLAPAPPRSEPLSQEPAQRILDSLAWYEALGITAPSKVAVGFLSGYRVNKKLGGNYGSSLGQLNRDGLVHYPGSGAVSLTDAGRAVARDPGIERTNEAFRQAVYARLESPEIRILEHLIEAFPGSIGKVELGQLAGYTVNAKLGGNYGSALGKLRSFGLIDYPARGVAAALPILFPEGA